MRGTRGSYWRGRDACNDFSIGVELEGTDDQPYDERQYESLSIWSLLCSAPIPARGRLDRGAQRHRAWAQDRSRPAFDWRWLSTPCARAAPSSSARCSRERPSWVALLVAAWRSRPSPSARERIVSVAPNLTEMLFAAGAADTSWRSCYSDFPEAARPCPRSAMLSGSTTSAIVALRRPCVTWRPERRPASPSGSRPRHPRGRHSRRAVWTTSRRGPGAGRAERARASRASWRRATTAHASLRCATEYQGRPSVRVFVADRRRAALHRRLAAPHQGDPRALRRGEHLRRCAGAGAAGRPRVGARTPPEVILSTDDRRAGAVLGGFVQLDSGRARQSSTSRTLTCSHGRARASRTAPATFVARSRGALRPDALLAACRGWCFQSTSLPLSWRASTRASTNSRSERRLRYGAAPGATARRARAPGLVAPRAGRRCAPDDRPRPPGRRPAG